MDSPEQNMQMQERLIGDLRVVIENAEELLKNTNQYDGGPYQDARAKLTRALQTATDELSRFEDAQLLRMMEATSAVNELFNDQTGEAKLLRAFQ